ncbi:hypothetical protein AB1Y20_016793 [Prymnesium parvum]|uniref:Chitin synthase n=1 Tax=Prymnesium parvum TaxID=97485 RepID=A0AB34ID30_PRYPA
MLFLLASSCVPAVAAEKSWLYRVSHGVQALAIMFALLHVVVFLLYCICSRPALPSRPSAVVQFLACALAYFIFFALEMLLVPPAAERIMGKLDTLQWILFAAPIAVYVSLAAIFSCASCMLSRRLRLVYVPTRSPLYKKAEQLNADLEATDPVFAGGETSPAEEATRKVNEGQGSATALDRSNGEGLTSPESVVRKASYSSCGLFWRCTLLMFLLLCFAFSACSFLGRFSIADAQHQPFVRNTSTTANEEYVLLTTLFRSEDPFWKRKPLRVADVVSTEIMLASFRRFNRRDRIMILFDDGQHPPPQLDELAKHYDAELWAYSSEGDPADLKPGNLRRWQMLVRWLKANYTQGNFSHIKRFIMLDATDMAFQRDPFSDDRLWASQKDFHFMNDVNGIPASQSAYFRQQATACFPATQVNEAALSAVNGGMIVGHTLKQLSDLADLVYGMARKCNSYAKDQHILQMLLELSKIPGTFETHPSGEVVFNIVQYTGNFQFDQDDNVVGPSGAVVTALHQ